MFFYPPPLWTTHFLGEAFLFEFPDFWVTPTCKKVSNLVSCQVSWIPGTPSPHAQNVRNLKSVLVSGFPGYPRPAQKSET